MSWKFALYFPCLFLRNRGEVMFFGQRSSSVTTCRVRGNIDDLWPNNFFIHARDRHENTYSWTFPMGCQHNKNSTSNFFPPFKGTFQNVSLADYSLQRTCYKDMLKYPQFKWRKSKQLFRGFVTTSYPGLIQFFLWYLYQVRELVANMAVQGARTWNAGITIHLRPRNFVSQVHFAYSWKCWSHTKRHVSVKIGYITRHFSFLFFCFEGTVALIQICF